MARATDSVEIIVVARRARANLTCVVYVAVNVRGSESIEKRDRAHRPSSLEPFATPVSIGYYCCHYVITHNWFNHIRKCIFFLSSVSLAAIASTASAAVVAERYYRGVDVWTYLTECVALHCCLCSQSKLWPLFSSSAPFLLVRIFDFNFCATFKLNVLLWFHAFASSSLNAAVALLRIDGGKGITKTIQFMCTFNAVCSAQAWQTIERIPFHQSHNGRRRHIELFEYFGLKSWQFWLMGLPNIILIDSASNSFLIQSPHLFSISDTFRSYCKWRRTNQKGMTMTMHCAATFHCFQCNEIRNWFIS